MMKSVSVVFTNRTYKWEVQKPKPRNPSVWNGGGIELFTPNLVLLIVENGGDPLSRRFPWLGFLNCSLTERVDNWTLLGDKGSWLPTQMIFVFTIGLSIISTERRVKQCTIRRNEVRKGLNGGKNEEREKKIRVFMDKHFYVKRIKDILLKRNFIGLYLSGGRMTRAGPTTASCLSL